MRDPLSSNPNVCEECGEPATQWILRDPFGKSDAKRSVCGEHGLRLRDPADVAEIERLTRELAEITADRDTLRDLLTDKGGMPIASSAHETGAVSLTDHQAALASEGQKDYRIEALEAALDWAIHAVFTHYTEGEAPAAPGAFEEIEKSRARYIAEAKRLAALPKSSEKASPEPQTGKTNT